MLASRCKIPASAPNFHCLALLFWHIGAACHRRQSNTPSVSPDWLTLGSEHQCRYSLGSELENPPQQPLHEYVVRDEAEPPQWLLVFNTVAHHHGAVSLLETMLMPPVSERSRSLLVDEAMGRLPHTDHRTPVDRHTKQGQRVLDASP